MIRVVLDANVFVSGLISKKGAPGQILDAWLEGQFSIFVSRQIMEEITRVFSYPRIQERLEPGESDRFIFMLRAASQSVDGNLRLEILSQDPSDNIYLACAVEARAAYLVSGNIKHYLEAGNPFQGVQILTPREFLTIIQSV